MTDMLEWPGPDDLRQRAGQCYTLAMECVLLNVNRHGARLHLVHGLLHPTRAEGVRDWSEKHPDLPLPPPNPHAWVELEARGGGVLTLDPVMRQAFARDDHVRQFGAETIRRYRADVAIDVAMRRGSYGPWDHRSLAEWEHRVAIAKADPRYSMAAAIDRHLGPASEARA